MKKLNKIALSVMAVVAVGIGFSGCDEIADESKAPLVKYDRFYINIYSQDDETIINKMIISGRNGKCDIKDLGNGGNGISGIERVKYLKYGEQFTYDEVRVVRFSWDWDGDSGCPPKNGKYEIELNTNFGTYYYEIRN